MEQKRPEASFTDTTTTTQAAAHNGEFSWLTDQQETRCIPVAGDNVRVITKPAEFYQELIRGVRESRERVSLSSLYLGTGDKEQELVSEIESALRRNPTAEVDVLLDYCRGSRGEVNSRTMLLPLLADREDGSDEERVRVSFYHTPMLRGVWKRVLPERINEIVGLQHIKAYVFDSRVIISGANLSGDYFTQRQDRYFVFDDAPELADYFQQLIGAVASFSFRLRRDGDVRLAAGCPECPVSGDFERFAAFARSKIEPIIYPQQQQHGGGDAVTSSDTLVYPSVQIGCLGLQQDERFTSAMLREFRRGHKVAFTSGYFNITEQYAEAVAASEADFDIVIASPEANGFLGSRGISGYIPFVYIRLTELFRGLLASKDRLDAVRLLEYSRPEWTYHAKGLWCHGERAAMTVVGSSNFGYRSVARDVEAQVTVVTTNAALKERLSNEQRNITNWSKLITPETFQQVRYRKPRFVSVISGLIRHFF